MERALSYAVENNNLTEIERLLSSGAKPTQSNIETCFVDELFETMKLFLKNDRSIANTAIYTGNTLLIESVLEKRSIWCDALIKFGCDVNHVDKNGFGALHYAVHSKDETVAALLLNASANPNAVAIKFQTPLVLAIRNSDVPMIHLLHYHGADMKKTSKRKKRPIHEAIATNNPKLVQIFIDSIDDINVRDRNERTPLMLAAMRGFGVIVSMLLKAGANKTLLDNAGKDAMYWAVWNGDEPTIVTLLEDTYTIPKTPTTDPKYPNLVFLAMEKRIKIDLIRVFLKKLPDFQQRNADSRTLMHMTILWTAINSKEINKECNSIIAILMGEGLDGYDKDARGITAIDMAIQFGRLDQLVLLLSDEDHTTHSEVLLHKIKNMHDSHVKALIACGIEVEMKHVEAVIDLIPDQSKLFFLKYFLFDGNILVSDNYKMAFNYASHLKHVDILKFLECFESWTKCTGDDPFTIMVKNKNTISPYTKLNKSYLLYELTKDEVIDIEDRLVKSTSGNAFMYLIAKLIDNNTAVLNHCLEKLIIEAKEDLAAYLIQHNVSVPLSSKKSLLLHCHEKLSVNFNNLLIEAGVAPIAVDNNGKAQARPLKQLTCISIRSHHGYFLELWKSCYARFIRFESMPIEEIINRRDENGHTFIIKSIINNNLKALIYLIEDGADPNMTDSQGLSALHYISFVKDDNMIRFLLELLKAKCNVNVKNSRGDTPLHLLAYRRKEDSVTMLKDKMEDEEIAKLLLDHGANIGELNSRQESPLMAAAFHSSSLVVNALLQSAEDANINAVDEHGMSALHYAAQRQRPNTSASLDEDKEDARIMSALLHRGADVNLKSKEQKTVLMLAACKSNIHVITILIDAGSDLNAADCDGNTAMHLISERKFQRHAENPTEGAEIASLLLKHGADPHILNNKRESPLMKAAIHRSTYILTTIVKAVDDVNVVDCDGNSALHLAVNGAKSIEEENAEIVNALIENGADVNLLSKNGMTALMLAVCYSNIRTIIILIDAKSNLNATDADDNTVMHIVSRRNSSRYTESTTDDKKEDAEIATVLLERGADPHKSNKTKESPLMTAVLHSNIDVVNVLIKHVDIDNVNAVNNNGLSALHFATQRKRTMQENAEIVTALIKNGADVNLPSYNKMSALMLAVCNSDIRTVIVLIDAKSNLNATDDKNNTVMHLVSRRKSVYTKEDKKEDAEIASVLLERGADPYKLNYNNQSPLMIAALHSNIDVVNVLIKYADNVNAVDDNGSSALHFAAKRNRMNDTKSSDESKEDAEIVNALIRHKADVNILNRNKLSALMLAVCYSNVHVIITLINFGSDVEAVDSNGSTLLHLISHRKSLKYFDNPTDEEDKDDAEIAYALLKLGHGVYKSNNKKESPLMTAAYYSNIYVVTVLLDNVEYIDIDDVDEDGLGVLHHAVQRPIAESKDDAIVKLIKMLIKRGADVNLLSKGKMSPIMWAVCKSSVGVITLLINAGSDVNAADDDGNTCLHLLTRRASSKSSVRTVDVERECNAIASILINNGADPWKLNNRREYPTFVG